MGALRIRRDEMDPTSKALAVAFLLVHAIFLAAPPITWAPCAGDASMLVAVGLLLRRHTRLSGGA